MCAACELFIQLMLGCLTFIISNNLTKVADSISNANEFQHREGKTTNWSTIYSFVLLSGKGQ